MLLVKATVSGQEKWQRYYSSASDVTLADKVKKLLYGRIQKVGYQVNEFDWQILFAVRTGWLPTGTCDEVVLPTYRIVSVNVESGGGENAHGRQHTVPYWRSAYRVTVHMRDGSAATGERRRCNTCRRK